MALTKQDIGQIKGVVHGEIENLARIVAKGFEQVDKRFEQVDKRFEQVDKHFEKVENELSFSNARLNTLERDVAEIKRHFVSRNEFEDALGRIAHLERKVGIHSGK